MFILVKMEIEKRQRVSESKTLSYVKGQETTRDYLTESVLFCFTSGGFVLFNVWFWARLI